MWKSPIRLFQTFQLTPCIEINKHTSKLNELILFCLEWDNDMFHTKLGSENVSLNDIKLVSTLN
jgi:hypothetical protein